MAPCLHSDELSAFVLRFEPLVAGVSAIDVPCDAAGRVDLNALDDRRRDTYFYARIVRRSRFAVRVVPVHHP